MRKKTKIPLEKAIRKEVRKYLKTRDDEFWFSYHGNPWQKKGLPDMIGCVDGYFIGIEIKRPILGKVTPLQALCHEDIVKAGGVVIVITSLVDLRLKLNAIKRRIQNG